MVGAVAGVVVVEARCVLLGVLIARMVVSPALWEVPPVCLVNVGIVLVRRGSRVRPTREIRVIGQAAQEVAAQILATGV